MPAYAAANALVSVDAAVSQELEVFAAATLAPQWKEDMEDILGVAPSLLTYGSEPLKLR
jgi:hypothetical protein